MEGLGPLRTKVVPAVKAVLGLKSHGERKHKNYESWEKRGWLWLPEINLTRAPSIISMDSDGGLTWGGQGRGGGEACTPPHT